MYASKEAYREAWQTAYTQDPPVPLNVDIELSAACNAKCTFCLYGDRDWREGMNQDDWDGKPKKRFMPTEMALAIIDECAKIGVPALKFNFRGESTIHKDFTRILTHAAAWGFHAGRGAINPADWSKPLPARGLFHDLLVNTNGNCPEPAIDGLMCTTKLMVSLDSMDPAIYPKVRVGLSLEHAQRTIDELVRRGHPDLWVRRVICKDNEHEKFVEAVKSRWPTGVKVSEHYAFDRNHYQNEAIHKEDMAAWERTFCGYTAQRAVVDASGRYVPCCIAWEGELDSGMRWPKDSIMDYWRSDFRKNLSSQLRANDIRNDKCKKCTSYMAYKRPERDFVQDVEVKA